jgi:aspartyl aminopeptidase
MQQEIKSLLKFLACAPTAWHAVADVSQTLQKAGFELLQEEEPWKLSPGGRYFTIRNGTSLCAFITPQQSLKTAKVVASHTDSPGFKLKPNAEFRKENMIMLGLEMYGAPLLSSWLNRDLGIAGRIITINSEGTIEETLVRFDEHPVVIPQLAIHLDRQVNETGLLLNKQEHLAALAALSDGMDPKASYLETLIKEKIGDARQLGKDLYLFPIEPPAYVGSNKQMIAAYRIDNLCSVHASITALTHSLEPNPTDLKMAILWDNEEIGSETAQGAGSPFATHVLERIALAHGLSREEFFCLLRRSLCLSVDLAHGMHPNYPERHEPRHPILLNRGVVLKSNAQSRYASDARSSAAVVNLCQQHHIPLQNFVTRGDIPCGSTIGPIHASKTGMPTVDIGCPQLSMHSCRELVACQDHVDMCRLLKAFYG